jgi:beta-lactamase regulating signal transducer with metallopeptidase domain
MKSAFDAIAYWVIDYYLAATFVLAVVAVAQRMIQQPARRLALYWGSLVGLTLLALLCILPGWPRIDVRAVAAAVPEASSRVTAVFPSFALSHRAAAGSAGGASLSAGSAAFWSQLADRDLGPARLFVLVIFAVGCLLTGFRIIHGVLAARRLRLGSSRAPRSIVAVLEALVGREPCPELLVTRSHPIPIVTGALRPRILLPPQFAEKERPDDCRSVLAHEWAHIQNGDLWLLALDRWLLPLLCLHPLYWRLRRSVRDDQELLADSFAASHSSRTDYADMLVRWARRLVDEKRARQLAAALGVWDRPTRLADRISRLLQTNTRLELRCPRVWRVGSLLALTALPVMLSTATIRPDAPRSSPAMPCATARRAASPECCRFREVVDPIHEADRTQHAFEQPAITEVERLGGSVKSEWHGPISFVTAVNMVFHFTEDGRRVENKLSSDEALRDIARFCHLKMLTLAGRQITDLGLQQMSTLHELNYLILRDARWVSPAGLAQVAKMTQLRRLELTNAPFGDGPFAHLTALQSLEELTVEGSPLSQESLAVAARLPNLRSLSLDLPNRTIGREALTGLRPMEHLTRLSLHCAAISDDAVSELAAFKHLRWLSLGDSHINPGAVAELSRSLPQLSVQSTLPGRGRVAAEQTHSEVRRDDGVLARVREFAGLVRQSPSRAARLMSARREEAQYRIFWLRNYPSLKNVDWQLVFVEPNAALAVSSGFSNRLGATLVFTCRLRKLGEEWKIEDLSATCAGGIDKKVLQFASSFPQAKAADEWIDFMAHVR